MKDLKTSDYPVGVIVGRFQAHQLTEGHKYLIDTVVKNHKKVIIFIGCSPVLNSKRNPLDFASRKRMISAIYENCEIVPITDCNSDEVWSKNLDTKIKEIFPIGKPLLYGSRDSFISHYKGNHSSLEIESDIIISATEIRKNISEQILSSEDFRAGVIYHAHNRYPISYQTVDIAVVNKHNQLLLARKPNEHKYRFVGGFVDPTDLTLEAAAKRELGEETGGNGNFDSPVYVSSHRINDWRYRSEVDKIMTSLFLVNHLWGPLEPADDIAELRWVKVEDIQNLEELLMPEHIPLMISLLSYLKTKN